MIHWKMIRRLVQNEWKSARQDISTPGPGADRGTMWALLASAFESSGATSLSAMMDHDII